MRRVRVLADGLGFTEGPVIMQDGTIVVVSMSHGRVYAIEDDRARVVAETEAAANGAVEWSDGSLYIAHFWGWPPAKEVERSTGGVLRADRSGAIEWLTRDPVAPNDLCFGPDGHLYVTDPTRPRRPDGRLWRCDIETGQAEWLVSLPWSPNGIGFGLEDDRIYVASTYTGQIMVFPFEPGGPLGPPEVFCQLPSGRPDGFAFDAAGNLVVAAPSGSEEQSLLHVFDREGRYLEGYAPLPSNRLSNVALGPDRTLIVTDIANGSVFAVDDWPEAGLPLHPFRSSAER
jgi:gluconolactonase